MRTYSLRIYGRPRPKRRPRKGKGGNFYTPRETKEWEAAVLAAWVEKFGPDPIFPPDCPLAIGMWFYFSDRRVPDLSNLQKAIEDALCSKDLPFNVIGDDKRIVLSVAVRHPDPVPKEEEGVEIIVVPFYKAQAFAAWRALVQEGGA